MNLAKAPGQVYGFGIMVCGCRCRFTLQNKTATILNFMMLKTSKSIRIQRTTNCKPPNYKPNKTGLCPNHIKTKKQIK